MRVKPNQQTQSSGNSLGITILGVFGYSVAGAFLGALLSSLLYCAAEFENPGKPENGWLILLIFLFALNGAVLGFLGSALAWLLQAGTKALSLRK